MRIAIGGLLHETKTFPAVPTTEGDFRVARTAYRTAPHRDVAETRERGSRLLLDSLNGGLRPNSNPVKLPLLLAGEEAAVTEVEPARALYARLPNIDRVPGVLVSSILIGFARTDSPQTGVSVVVSGTDGNVIREMATQLAGKI